MSLLPVGWGGKRVVVRFSRQDSSHFEVTVEGQNEGGFFARQSEEEFLAFIPWTAVSYIQLLEEPDEPEMMIGRAE